VGAGHQMPLHQHHSVAIEGAMAVVRVREHSKVAGHQYVGVFQSRRQVHHLQMDQDQQMDPPEPEPEPEVVVHQPIQAVSKHLSLFYQVSIGSNSRAVHQIQILVRGQYLVLIPIPQPKTRSG